MKPHNKLGIMAAILLVAAVACQAGSIGISVKGGLKKDHDTNKSGGGNSSKRVESETQNYMLDISISNMGAEDGTFDLEWYFFKQPLSSKGDKGAMVVCEDGKATFQIRVRDRVNREVKSKGLMNSETKTTTRSKSRGRGRSGGSNQKKSYSGAVYAGYALLVRQDGQLVAKAASDSRFLKDEWLGRLNQSASGKASGNGRKKSK